MYNHVWKPPAFGARAPQTHPSLSDKRAVEASNCLPSELTASVPNCAIPCIQTFAQANYEFNACSYTSSLTYFCTQRTSSGLTIGEGSLQCLYSNCSGKDLAAVGVYNICASIPGAMANTAGTITATIRHSSTEMATNLTSSIGNPTSTQQITSIVMASGMPDISVTTAPPTTFTSLTSTSPSSLISQSTVVGTSPVIPSASISPATALPAGSASPPSAPITKTTLNMTQVVGIAVGAGGVAIIALGLLLFCCCRRKMLQGRRRSNRWSTHPDDTPPPTYHGPDPTKAQMSARNGLLSRHDPGQRFYARVPPTSIQENRRSFWRKSIKPEDIGVAVSPKVDHGCSPTSISSQQSMSKLLPKPPPSLPARALWPAPLNLQVTRQHQRQSARPISASTVFDEELEEQKVDSSNVPEVSDTHDLPATEKVQRKLSLPEPELLTVAVSNNQRSSVKRDYNKPSSARIPLTPTYDNGCFVDQLSRKYPPSSYPVSRDYPVQVPPVASDALQEHRLPSTSAYAKRNVLRKQVPQRPPFVVQDGLAINPPDLKPPPPPRKDSETTVNTEIEDQLTPEEVEKQLQDTRNTFVKSSRPLPTPIVTKDLPRSPIADLTYPSIPRSAAISAQAETTAKPLSLSPSYAKAKSPLVFPLPPPPRSRFQKQPPLHDQDNSTFAHGPTRTELVRAGASFMQTDSTSSDGFLSDQGNVEWHASPTPGTTNMSAFKANMARLRENRDSVNRGLPIQRRPDSYGGLGMEMSLNHVVPSNRSGSIDFKGEGTGTFVVVEDSEIGSEVGSRAGMGLRQPQTPVQRPPPSKVRVTPRKGVTGDLYLTVEI